MDISKLDQNEKLAIYGSAAVILAGLISNFGGLLFLSILAAVGMIVVVLLPQLSAGTSLPGSKGTLMAALGIVAAVGAVIAVLPWLGLLGAILASFNTILFLIAVIGALVMAWAGWQELQAEGGKWEFGARRPTATAAPAATAMSASEMSASEMSASEMSASEMSASDTSDTEMSDTDMSAGDSDERRPPEA